jgi:hypothetical protein
MEPVGSLAHSQAPAPIHILSQIKPSKQFKKQLKNRTHSSLTQILMETSDMTNITAFPISYVTDAIIILSSHFH